MKSKISNLIFTLIAIILAIVFIILTLRQTNFEALKSAAKNANYFWFLVSVILSIVSYWLRAARSTLLFEGINYNVSTKNGFWAISFGYFMNLTIPRSGEIARATTLYRLEKIPVDKSIGTIVLERVIDLLFLALFFVLTFIFNAETLLSFFSFSEQPSLGKFILPIGVLVGVFTFFFLFRKSLNQFKLYQKINVFLIGIWEGFKSILHLKNRGKFLLYSIGIWICYFLMTYLIVFAFPETAHFGLGEGFFLIVAGALGMILPAVGGLGYPYIMSIAFAAIYVTQGQTAAEGKVVGNYFGLLLYFAQVIMMLLFGLLSILYINRNTQKIN
ncbi:MAG: lysylphosphatidylglycerol synthase transmembrane domain-containing protein [Moheibacter sp.]